ncbi:DUF1810 domain-containing protein [Maribius pontilimi]|uniref:DUF1810 domain-containing protein n=1 Tax=Palleronia pontilimi TaxID=1964209 RepID=A0A934IIP1_9RHOB|nr:DUF1810 domain-containing protein [Palleronia pontilimi]MBJ3764080.1 DUF1810 domain-containing protein [Palleronia pontilimi]
MDDAGGLDRFIAAQDATYAQAKDEVTRGRKTSHWMWFIFPQLRGLGRSLRAEYYGIADLDEATRYLAHPVLGLRLVEMFDTLLAHHPRADPVDIFGKIDAAKLRSSATLFARVPDAPIIFQRALDAYFDGPCPRTEALL